MRREFGCITEVERGKRYRVSWTEDGVKKSHRVRGTRRDASDYLAKVQAGIEGAAKDVIDNDRYAVLSDLWNCGPDRASEVGAKAAVGEACTEARHVRTSRSKRVWW